MNPVGIPESRQTAATRGWQIDRGPAPISRRTGSLLPQGGPKVHRQKYMVSHRRGAPQVQRSGSSPEHGTARPIEKGLSHRYPRSLGSWLPSGKPGCWLGCLPPYEPLMVSVAQLVRARGCGPRGRGFESPRSPFPASCPGTNGPLEPVGLNVFRPSVVADVPSTGDHVPAFGRRRKEKPPVVHHNRRSGISIG